MEMQVWDKIQNVAQQEGQFPNHFIYSEPY
jgi:hypothetical protein